MEQIKIWAVGCSFAHGVGLETSDQRYGQLVADYLGLEARFLTTPGSSVEWAHDQIIHSDIQANDIVLWGVTSLERFSYFSNLYQPPLFVNAMNLTQNRLGEYTGALKILFTSDHWTIRNIKLIEQAQTVINKTGARLILFFHPELSLLEHGKMFYDIFSESSNLLIPECTKNDHWNGTWPPTRRNFLDFGNDDSHPGPNTHQAWAEQITSFIKERF